MQIGARLKPAQTELRVSSPHTSMCNCNCMKRLVLSDWQQKNKQQQGIFFSFFLQYSKLCSAAKSWCFTYTYTPLIQTSGAVYIYELIGGCECDRDPCGFVLCILHACFMMCMYHLPFLFRFIFSFWINNLIQL